MLNTASIIPESFNLFGLRFHLYGLIIALSVLILYSLTRSKLEKQGVHSSKLDIVFVSSLVLGLIGGRVGYILFHIQEFQSANLGQLFALNSGGIHFFGVVVGLIVALLITSKFLKLNLINLTDSVALFAPLAQAIGRLANLPNLELFGEPTNLPWGIFIPANKRPIEFTNNDFFHPTFLYEAVLNLASFFIILLISKTKSLPKGLLTAVYFMNYGLIRFFTEFYREDTEEIFLGLKLTQFISIGVFATAFSTALYLFSKQKQSKKKAF